MEELDLKELLNYYLKRMPIIILITLLAILLGYGYIEYYQVPMYHGKTTIILIQKNDNQTGTQNNINETENQLNVNEKLVTTYSEIIKSRRVLEQVKTNLELKESLKTLSDNIEVDSVSDTSIIEITVSNENAKQAAIIANQLAEVFKSEITELYNLENISIIDEAIAENNPYNVNIPKQMLIYISLGIIISCMFIFIMYYFDNTIKNRKEIETKLDIPVLGEVPLSLKLVKKAKKEASAKKKTKDKFSKRIKKRIQNLKEKQAQKKKISQEKRIQKLNKKQALTKQSKKETKPDHIKIESKEVAKKEKKTTKPKKKTAKEEPKDTKNNKTKKKVTTSKATAKKNESNTSNQKKKTTTKNKTTTKKNQEKR